MKHLHVIKNSVNPSELTRLIVFISKVKNGILNQILRQLIEKAGKQTLKNYNRKEK